jgi:hypothetical protein
MASRGPSLTFFFIGLIVFVGVMLLIFDPQVGLYSNFLTANGATPDNAYTSAFVHNLNTSKGELTGLSNNFQGQGQQSVAQSGINIVNGVFSTLAIGFGAIGTLALLPSYFTEIFGGISSMLGIGGTIIAWMIITVAGIFLINKFIKALRGQIDDN